MFSWLFSAKYKILSFDVIVNYGYKLLLAAHTQLMIPERAKYPISRAIVNSHTCEMFNFSFDEFDTMITKNYIHFHFVL